MKREMEPLPFEVDETRWGKLVMAKVCCSGVYFIATEQENSCLCNEYYAVVEDYDGKAISTETLAYGVLSDGAYYFKFGEDGTGWKLVEFELLRYQTKYGEPVWGLTDNLYCTATYATELYPEYFGCFIPPRLTPYGQTIRYKTVTNGIYFLETDRCVWLLAICYPIWNAEISDYTHQCGALCKETQAITDEEFNYLFFTADRCAPVIYELSQANQTYSDGFKRFVSSFEELIAAMWETCPEYVILHNYMEQTGNGPDNLLNRILSAWDDDLEEDEDTEISTINCIAYNPSISGESYLLLP